MPRALQTLPVLVTMLTPAESVIVLDVSLCSPPPHAAVRARVHRMFCPQ